MQDVFVIPTKKNVVTNTKLRPSWHHSLLASVPEKLREHAQVVVSEIEANAFDSALKYITTLTTTYAFLMEEVRQGLGAILEVHIQAENPGVFNANDLPTLQKWKVRNPAKTAALHIVESDLVSKGWKPSLHLNTFTYHKSKDCYEGGNGVIFSCSLVD